MGSTTTPPDLDDSPDDSTDLVERAVGGDPQALEELFAHYRDRLKRMVHLRLDRRLRGRVDDSDVLRETRVEAGQRLSEYAENSRRPFFLWLRQIAGAKLAEIKRRELGESVTEDELVSLHHGALPEANSVSLAAHLLGTMASPSEAAIKVDTRIHVQEALNDMDSTEREILALKHFERLDMDEISEVLGLSRGEIGKRYLRAIKQLRSVLSRIPGFRGL